MTTLRLKGFNGIKEVGGAQKLQFYNHPITHFNFVDFRMSTSIMLTFAPVATNLKSGWIIDGRFLITDDGVALGEGFNWHKDNIGYVMTAQNEKLRVKANSKNLSLTGFTEGNPSYDFVREIDDYEVENSIFLSGFNNLSHFMMENAPKTLLFSALLSNFSNIKTVISNDLVPKKWIDYSIRTADSIHGSDSDLTIKLVNSNKAVRFKNIIVISSSTYREFDERLNMSRDFVKNFGKQMCKNAFSSSNQDSYILYMSRKNASHRRTLNQQNLIKIVQKIFPDLKLILEHNIHLLTMDDQAKLIYNASLIIEEGGGSTAFVNNLIGENVPCVIIQTAQRINQAGRLYLAGLDKYAAWVFGEPIGELSKSAVIDNDILVDENNFETLLIRLSLFIENKMPMPKIDTGI
tara:strand:- start:471 stop:1688 length:1218 start_codon:yes stop_codon:yes gene_type:complete